MFNYYTYYQNSYIGYIALHMPSIARCSINLESQYLVTDIYRWYQPLRDSRSGWCTRRSIFDKQNYVTILFVRFFVEVEIDPSVFGWPKMQLIENKLDLDPTPGFIIPTGVLLSRANQPVSTH